MQLCLIPDMPAAADVKNVLLLNEDVLKYGSSHFSFSKEICMLCETVFILCIFRKAGTSFC